MDKKLLPWKILSSKVALKTPWFVIKSYECQTPTGRRVPAYFVSEEQDGVMAICITRSRRVVMVAQYRFPMRAVSLDFPAGTVEPKDENLAAAALRELFEETGFVGSEAKHLFSMVKNPAVTGAKMHVFLVKGARRKRGWRAQRELTVVRLMTPAQVFAAIESGEISCAFCTAVALRADRILKWRM